MQLNVPPSDLEEEKKGQRGARGSVLEVALTSWTLLQRIVSVVEEVGQDGRSSPESVSVDNVDVRGRHLRQRIGSVQHYVKAPKFLGPEDIAGTT